MKFKYGEEKDMYFINTLDLMLEFEGKEEFTEIDKLIWELGVLSLGEYWEKVIIITEEKNDYFRFEIVNQVCKDNNIPIGATVVLIPHTQEDIDKYKKLKESV